MLPVLQDLTQNMTNRTVGYQSRAMNADGQARTAYEVRAQLQQEAVLSSASINLFYHPWKRLLTEVYRRLSRRKYTAIEPGGREAVDFRRRCIKRGVPEEAIYRWRSVEPVRAIGFGSPGMRQLAIEETMAIFGSLDEAGRINLLRDRIAARFGQEVVDRYLPAPGTSLRPPMDDKMAVIENGMMSSGSPMPVSDGENHFIHASRHLQALEQMQEGIANGADPMAALQAMDLFLPHLAEHVQRLGNDLVRKDQVALMRQRLQQLGAARDRMADELKAAAEKQAMAQQAEQQRMIESEQARIAAMEQKLAESEQLSPKARQELMERQAKLQMEIERHQATLALKQAETSQKMALKDAETAAKVKMASRMAVPEITTPIE